ncbi:MAG: alpha/beta hydrolase [Deltaproteobacteria bacterium]|nr:alpha/beta hydrolase [Deltaproteobacteria bacterium]
MQITKQMHDQDLQGQYGALRFLVSMNKKNWGLWAVNRMVRMVKGQNVKGVDNDTVQVPSTHTDDHQIRTRVYRPEGCSEKIPAMVYFHGGGYMMGIPEMANTFYGDVLERRKVAIFSPDYRLSRTDPFPAGFNDCYDVLLWVRDNAEQLNVDPNNIIIAGHSAGGGMAAAITLKARDTRDVEPIFQMPVYPMLDHRMTTASSQMLGSTMWDAEINARAWKLYLRDLDGAVPPYASPALNEDYRDFPPTISFVGDLEPFHDENIAYIEGLKSAGVHVEFKVFKGGYHGFEVGSPNAAISKAANRFQLDAFEAFYDAYVRT